MCIAAAIAGAGVVGSVGGGLIAAHGASKAANAQVQAADTAAQTQQNIFNQQVALQEPFRQAGITAEDRLLTLLGLSPAANDTTQSQPQNAFVMGPDGYPIYVGGGYGGTTLNVPASGLSVDPNSPDFGKYAKDFSMADYQADPGYAFRLSEGMKALQNSFAAKGLAGSGASAKGALKYGQDLASQEYQNAFNRYQTNRANQLNPLQSLAGQAQTSANTLTNAAGQAGSSIADLQTQAGNARASGYVGGANALTSALGGIGNAAAGYGNNYMLNSFLNGGSGGLGYHNAGYGGGLYNSGYVAPTLDTSGYGGLTLSPIDTSGLTQNVVLG